MVVSCTKCLVCCTRGLKVPYSSFSLVTRDWQVASGMRILLGGLSATVVSGEGSFIPKWCRSRTRRPIVKFDSRGRHGQGCALTSSGTGGYMFRPIGIRHTHMRYKARTAFIPIFQSERAQPPSHEPRTFRILAEKTLHISKTFQSYFIARSCGIVA